MWQVVYFRKTTDSIMAPGLEPQIIKLDAGREFSAAMWLDGDATGTQWGLGFATNKAMGERPSVPANLWITYG